MLCNGITKNGLQCTIAWQLDALGFCKYHTQLTRQCLAVATSTNKRCKTRWNLDANGFCKDHQSQAPSSTKRCVAIAQSTNKRCCITTGLDVDGLCSVHMRTYSTLQRICHGVVSHTGLRCTNDAKPHYDYCCAIHDPSQPYFSPRLFDLSNKPRSILEPHIVRYYGGRDLYHGDMLNLVTPGAVELDHILEKQCWVFAFRGIPFFDPINDAAYLASIVGDEFVNGFSNVCLTRTTTNKIKGAAVWKFIDDTITGHTKTGDRLTYYLLAEQRDDQQLNWGTAQTITSEMRRVLKACQYKLADQGETPLVYELSCQLQRISLAMGLESR